MSNFDKPTMKLKLRNIQGVFQNNQNIFLDLVNEELSNLSPDQIKDPDNTIKEPKSVKVESKIDMSTVSENTKVKIKEIQQSKFIQIIRIVHNFLAFIRFDTL